MWQIFTTWQQKKRHGKWPYENLAIGFRKLVKIQEQERGLNPLSYTIRIKHHPMQLSGFVGCQMLHLCNVSIATPFPYYLLPFPYYLLPSPTIMNDQLKRSLITMKAHHLNSPPIVIWNIRWGFSIL